MSRTKAYRREKRERKIKQRKQQIKNATCYNCLYGRKIRNRLTV